MTLRPSENPDHWRVVALEISARPLGSKFLVFVPRNRPITLPHNRQRRARNSNRRRHWSSGAGTFGRELHETKGRMFNCTPSLHKTVLAASPQTRRLVAPEKALRAWGGGSRPRDSGGWRGFQAYLSVHSPQPHHWHPQGSLHLSS